jgi:hypothetical protein
MPGFSLSFFNSDDSLLGVHLSNHDVKEPDDVDYRPVTTLSIGLIIIRFTITWYHKVETKKEG